MAFKLICTVLALGLFALSWRGPKARPQQSHDGVFAVITIVAIIAAFQEVPVYPAAVSVPLWALAAPLILLAVSAPLAGLIENALLPSTHPYSPERFRNHLLMNSLGAASAIGFLALGRAATGDTLGERFSNDFMLNIFLPMSGLLALTFIRWQQIKACPALAVTPATEPPENCYFADSLSRWHQRLNLIHLMAAVFTITTTLLYVLGDTMSRTRAGHPPTLNMPTLVVIAVSLLFVVCCGLPWAWSEEGVFVMFLTGTPASLCIMVMWLTMYAQSPLRDITAFAFVFLGYSAYVVLVLMKLRHDKAAVQLHYFSALVMFVVLMTLLGAMYASPSTA